MDTALLPFEEYSQRFTHLRLTRRDGVLELTQHSDGAALQWGGLPQMELGQAFRLIASDRENKVVIFTAAGDRWNGPPALDERQYRRNPTRWDLAIWNGYQLQMALLDVPVPVIAAINGPVYRHVELPLYSDIVLATPDVTFDDRGHFPVNLMAGDGVFTATSTLLGHNRARYFHLTGQILTAQTAHELGLVAEIVPRDTLLERAWELGEQLASRPLLTLRYQRLVFTQRLKRYALDELLPALALEGLAASSDDMPTPPQEGMSSSVY